MGVLAPALRPRDLRDRGPPRQRGRGGACHRRLRPRGDAGRVALLSAERRRDRATRSSLSATAWFGGRNWSAEAARGLDDYYAAYRETYAEKRGGRAYGSWREALRFPWDATMAPYAFENVGRFAYDVGPFVLAFLPLGVLLWRDPLGQVSLAGVGLAYSAIVVLGMGSPRYIHPTLPLFLVVAVQALWMLGSTAARRRGGRGARVHGGAAGRDGAPSPGAARAGQPARRDGPPFGGRVPPPLRTPLSALGSRQSRGASDRQRPHPRHDPPSYHVLRPFTLASPLEQGAIDYRQLATVDDLTAALAPFGVTHVVREPEEDKAAANPIGERVTRLWDELIARAEKVGDSPTGALYRLPAVVAGERHTGATPASDS
jgi:hypothetical protein